MLKELNLTIKFHATFCNPQAQIDAIEDYSNKGTVLKYINGAGLVIGNYVIMSGKNNIKKLFTDGVIQSCELELNLKEYYIADKKGSANIAARKKAFAINTQQTVPLNTEINTDDNITLSGSKDVIAMNSSVSTTTQLMLDLRNATNLAEKISGAVTKTMDKLTGDVDKLQNRISEAAALANLIQQAPARLAQLRADAITLKNLMPIDPTSPTGLAAIYQSTDNVKSSMSFVNYTTSPMAAFAGWRGTFPGQ